MANANWHNDKHKNCNNKKPNDDETSKMMFIYLLDNDENQAKTEKWLHMNDRCL